MRIRDRRVGIPYICFMTLILAYNIFILFVEKKYLKFAAVDGVTRLQVRLSSPVAPVVGVLCAFSLMCVQVSVHAFVCVQLQEPDIQFRKPFAALKYCNQTSTNGTYITHNMQYPYYQGGCANFNANQVVFPPDEANAMFITSRLSMNAVYAPAGVALSCARMSFHGGMQTCAHIPLGAME